MKFRQPRGFTLIELMAVLAIIMILMAVAIPALSEARQRANETNAVGMMRVITRAETAYALAFNSGYSSDLYALGPTYGGNPTVNRADLVDSNVAGTTAGNRTVNAKGYTITYNPVGSYPQITLYTLAGSPTTLGTTGRRYFFADQTTVIRSNRTVPAGPSDIPIPD
jgi:type IV pilus assembly protein PilA